MSIRTQSISSHLSRRRLVQGTAAGAALAALVGRGLPTLAQDATPAASPGACGEPFDPGLLSTVKMVTDGSPITVAIVPKGVHPFFEDCRTGGNEEAARLAGINVNNVKMFAYTTSGFLASVFGIILLSRLVSAQPTAGLGQELPVIAASIIGGTSLVGGEGTALGAVLGAAIVGLLENGIVLLGINTYAQQVVTGAAIILAVALDIWQKRRRQRVG